MFWCGLLLCALLGGELGAIVAGALTLTDAEGSGVALFVIGLNLAPWTGLAGFGLLFAGSRRRQAGSAPAVLEPALARIETVRATGEGPEIPLRLDLTVAPTGRRAYRVEAHAVVNLMDLDDFRAGRNLVVDHDPERPWHVRVRRNPGADWAGRVALTKIDSAPVESRVSEPPTKQARRAVARPGLLAMGMGLLLSVWPLWG